MKPAPKLRLVAPQPETPPQPSSPSATVVSALLLIQVCFGMNYIFSKVVMAIIPPLLWASLRAIATAFVLVLVAKSLGKLQIRKALRYHRHFITFAALGIVINQACFLTGLSYTTPTNSALINTLIPIFTILLVIWRKQEAWNGARVIGCMSAFIGVLALQDFSQFSWGNQTVWGDGLTLLNALSYSLFLSYSQRFFEKHDFIWSTTWLFVFGAIGLTIVAAPQYVGFDFASVPSKIWIFALGGVVIGAAIPYALISFTLARTGSSVVALFVYIQALIAAGLSYFILNEPITKLKLVAAALIFIGLFFAVSQKLPFRLRRD